MDVNFAGFFGVEGVKVSNRKLAVFLFVVTALVSGGSVRLRAQAGDAAGPKRKVKTLATPQYPELAKKLNLNGIVRIEIIIGPDGKVKHTRVVGGHPVLAAEAERAASQSQFEPGPKETTEVIDFKFGAQ
jgi:TonB family protein